MEVLSQTAPATEWETSTAMDIRLGEVFNDGTLPEGSFLHIDTDTINECIERFGSGISAARTLHVELVHPSNIIEGESLREQTESLGGTVAGAFYVTDQNGKVARWKHPEQEVLHCDVSISRDAISMTEEFRPSALPVDDGASRTYESYPLMGISQGSMQHELQHATDYMQPEIIKAERRHNLKIAAQVAGILAVLLASEGAGYAAVAETTALPSNWAALLGSVPALAGAVLVRQSRRLRRYFYAKANHDSPSEMRAYEAEEDISIPPFVTLNLPKI